MKKYFILAVMVLMSTICTAQIKREGNTFTKVTNSRTKVDTICTNYTWEIKGVIYPIAISKASGACYIGRISSKTGKYYRSYLPQEVSAEISKELGIEYKPKK